MYYCVSYILTDSLFRNNEDELIYYLLLHYAKIFYRIFWNISKSHEYSYQYKLIQCALLMINSLSKKYLKITRIFLYLYKMKILAASVRLIVLNVTRRSVGSAKQQKVEEGGVGGNIER